MSAPTPARMPRQIPFIIANEGCERFSFYGMRNILTPFLATSLLLYLPEAQREGAAKDVFHSFVIGVYFFPLLGGWISDRLLGKYRTVMWLSLVYCLGHACLAVFDDNPRGFYAGLFLIALGSGGIKPLVASFVGDQFDQSNKHLAKLVFDGFYWIINFGSFFASLLMPIFLRDLGPSWAFGIPGLLMLIATIVFWSGRDRYVVVPPAPADPDSFIRVVRTALFGGGGRRAGFWLAAAGFGLAAASLLLIPSLGLVPALCLALVFSLAFAGGGTWIELDRARGKHPDEAIEGVRAVLRVLIVFAFVTPFWSLFDQKASTWILQANDMAKPSWFQPSQMQALNPALVMLLIPFNNLVLFPLLRRRGLVLTPLRKMTMGIAFSGAAWVVVGAMQLVIDGGSSLSITWQILPYALLTIGEVLVSATGLEFAQGPWVPVSMGAGYSTHESYGGAVGKMSPSLNHRSHTDTTEHDIFRRAGWTHITYHWDMGKDEVTLLVNGQIQPNTRAIKIHPQKFNAADDFFAAPLRLGEPSTTMTVSRGQSRNWSADSTIDEFYLWKGNHVDDAQELWSHGRYYIPRTGKEAHFDSKPLQLTSVDRRAMAPPTNGRPAGTMTTLGSQVRVLGAAWTWYPETTGKNGEPATLDYRHYDPLTTRVDLSMILNGQVHGDPMRQDGGIDIRNLVVNPGDSLSYRLSLHLPDAELDSILLATPIVDDVTIFFTTGTKFLYYELYGGGL